MFIRRRVGRAEEDDFFSFSPPPQVVSFSPIDITKVFQLDLIYVITKSIRGVNLPKKFSAFFSSTTSWKRLNICGPPSQLPLTPIPWNTNVLTIWSKFVCAFGDTSVLGQAWREIMSNISPNYITLSWFSQVIKLFSMGIDTTCIPGLCLGSRNTVSWSNTYWTQEIHM